MSLVSRNLFQLCTAWPYTNTKWSIMFNGCWWIDERLKRKNYWFLKCLFYKAHIFVIIVSKHDYLWHVWCNKFLGSLKPHLMLTFLYWSWQKMVCCFYFYFLFFSPHQQVCEETCISKCSHTTDYQPVTGIELKQLPLFNWKMQELQLISQGKIFWCGFMICCLFLLNQNLLFSIAIFAYFL